MHIHKPKPHYVLKPVFTVTHVKEPQQWHLCSD